MMLEPSPGARGTPMDPARHPTAATATSDGPAELPVTPQERFVVGIYAALDRATSVQLDRLQREQGITASCKRSCSHCCRFHIVVSQAEVHALAQHIRREFSTEQLEQLRHRVEQWHQWDDSRPGRHAVASTEPPPDLATYEQRCPLLVDGECSAYPARPVACRAHFVSSDPRDCRAAIDPQSTAPAPITLPAVLAGTGPFEAAVRGRGTEAGGDATRSLMLLPQALAIELGWK